MPSLSIPNHICIVGSGVFGLSTAHALSKRPAYSNTRITVISWESHSETPASPDPKSSDRAIAASVDTTRIVRADYADPLYARLASEAQQLWRTDEWGSDGRYNETGLLITAHSGSSNEAYVRKALANVQSQSGGRRPEELKDEAAIVEGMRCNGSAARGTGNVGYVNHQSGWAHAARCMQYLEAQMIASGRVEFVCGEVVELMADLDATVVRGVKLADGLMVGADLTILATGAWTPSLVDLRGRASTTAHVMAYFDITADAARMLADMPVHLNLTSGCFVFPPNRKSDGGWELKAARHAFGYTNPARVRPLGCREDIRVSVPVSSSRSIPVSDQVILSEFLEKALPILGKIRGPSRTRLCHYLDTPKGNYIVAHHPEHRGLFLATGGSGHAFKFLPVLGEKIVDVLSETDPQSAWTEKWRYPERHQEDMVWCEDGSRSGEKNLTLPRASVSDGTFKARL